jgi:hypothetical protein
MSLYCLVVRLCVVWIEIAPVPAEMAFQAGANLSIARQRVNKGARSSRREHTSHIRVNRQAGALLISSELAAG